MRSADVIIFDNFFKEPEREHNEQHQPRFTTPDRSDSEGRERSKQAFQAFQRAFQDTQPLTSLILGCPCYRCHHEHASNFRAFIQANRVRTRAVNNPLPWTAQASAHP